MFAKGPERSEGTVHQGTSIHQDPGFAVHPHLHRNRRGFRQAGQCRETGVDRRMHRGGTDPFKSGWNGSMALIGKGHEEELHRLTGMQPGKTRLGKRELGHRRGVGSGEFTKLHPHRDHRTHRPLGDAQDDGVMRCAHRPEIGGDIGELPPECAGPRPQFFGLGDLFNAGAAAGAGTLFALEQKLFAKALGEDQVLLGLGDLKLVLEDFDAGKKAFIGELARTDEKVPGGGEVLFPEEQFAFGLGDAGVLDGEFGLERFVELPDPGLEGAFLLDHLPEQRLGVAQVVAADLEKFITRTDPLSGPHMDHGKFTPDRCAERIHPVIRDQDKRGDDRDGKRNQAGKQGNGDSKREKQPGGPAGGTGRRIPGQQG